MSSSETLTAARAIVACLHRHGVETVFGLPGVQLDELFNAFYHARDHIRLINPRHEQACAYMASGYAQTTGRLGVCTVVPGPGLLNAGAALATAFGCNTPVLCITGQIPSRFIGKGYGILHEVTDQMEALGSVTKEQLPITHPADVPDVISDAIGTALSGRRGPVVVEVAPDVLAAEGEVDFDEFDVAIAEAVLDEESVAAAASLLAAARRPAIYAGGGAFGAAQEVRTLAERLHAPVIMTQNGIGVLDSRHELAHTLISGHEIWPEVDVVLAVGTRLMQPLFDWGYDDGLKLIRVDVDPRQSAEPWTADVHLAADAKDVLARLDHVLAGEGSSAWNRDDLARYRAEAEAAMAEEMSGQHALTTAIRAGLPDDAFVAFDITQVGYHAWWGFPVHEPGTVIRQGYQGNLGYAFPTALGAKVAHPGRPVVCVTGDGGFMFNIQEMATAVQNGINLIIVVLNDGGYGSVRRYQKLNYDEAYIACDLENPDFVELAAVFGMEAMRAEGPAGLTAALREAVNHSAPVLIDVPVGEFDPWQAFFPRKRVRGL